MLFKKESILRNSYKGERVFILGNGPSIKDENLSFLKEEYSIGINASTLLEEKWGFTQDFYCVSDARFLNHPEKRKFATDCLSEKTKRFIRADLKEIDEPSLRSNTFYIPHLFRDGFSKNISVGYYYGCTTTMLAIQIAYHLGFQDVYLLGVDLRYGGENPRFYKENSVQLEDSFTSVQLMNIAKAGQIFRGESRNLYVCSSSSFLRLYLPFASLDKFN